MKLSVVSALVRKGIKFLILFVIFYYILTGIIIPFAQSNLAAMFPSKNAPTVSYGMLDPLEFVKKPLANPTPVYQLNTKDGKLPALPEQAIVYKYVPWRFSYADGTNAQKHALILGFTDADLVTDLKGEVYRWHSVATDGSLNIAIHSKEVNKESVLAGKYGQFTMGYLTQTSASTAAKDLFTSLGRFADISYKNGTQVVTFGRITATDIVSTLNSREAHLAKVDLFKTIGKTPVYGPDPKKGLLQVYIGSSPLNRDNPLVYPKVDAYYWETEPLSAATYPLVPLAQAWGAVSKGDGIISSAVLKDSNLFAEYTPVNVGKILVNNIYLAYYETPKLQKYMQPIYVFEGNFTSSTGVSGSIVIYYPAVSGKWITQPTATQNSVPTK